MFAARLAQKHGDTEQSEPPSRPDENEVVLSPLGLNSSSDTISTSNLSLESFRKNAVKWKHLYSARVRVRHAAVKVRKARVKFERLVGKVRSCKGCGFFLCIGAQ